jgi:hypothetical protein
VTSLQALELALLAELNREMARACDEMVNDAGESADTRQIAKELGFHRRDRARLFEEEAMRVARAEARDPKGQAAVALAGRRAVRESL